jgi:hypothetical protein
MNLTSGNLLQVKPVSTKMGQVRKNLTVGDTDSDKKDIHTVSFYHRERRDIYLITGDIADLRAPVVQIG